MTPMRRTVQRLDPLLVRGTVLLTASASIVALGYAALAAVSTGSLAARPFTTATAFLLLVTGALLFLVLSAPARSPMRAGGAHAVGILVVAGACLDVVTHDPLLDTAQTSWAPLAVAILLLPYALFRPQFELAAGTVLSTVLVSGAAWLSGAGLESLPDRLLYVLMTAFPLAALGGAATAFARVTVNTIALWGDQAAEASVDAQSALRTGIARSVQQEEVSALGAEVVPLFARIAETGAVYPEDRAEAALLADRIRGALVSERERSWLDSLLAELPHGVATGLVLDPDHVARRIPSDQRTALRAVLTAVIAHPAYRAGSLRVVVSGAAGGQQRVLLGISAGLDSTEARIRAGFLPYLAVVRTRFDEVAFGVQSASLDLRLSCPTDD